ncbi:hypothetical protein [Nostoc sp.]|uniref:hypothetical protein n=1 Tax=Nostoc sp. TaxID=1180 RepID=UPI002FF56CA5
MKIALHYTWSHNLIIVLFFSSVNESLILVNESFSSVNESLNSVIEYQSFIKPLRVYVYLDNLFYGSPLSGCVSFLPPVSPISRFTSPGLAQRASTWIRKTAEKVKVLKAEI